MNPLSKKQGMINSFDTAQATDAESDNGPGEALSQALDKRRDKLAKTKLGIEPDAEDED